MSARVSVEQRRKDLVEAAFHTMAQVGIAKATTRAICAEAGVHQSVFHYCFHSKKELYQELVRVIVVDMVDAAVTVPDLGSTAEAAVRTSMERGWSHVKARPGRQIFTYEFTTFVMRDPDLADLAAWQYQQYFEQTERLLLAIGEAADVEWSVPLPVLSRMMTSAMDGLLLGWLTDRDDQAVEDSLCHFTDYFASLTRPRTSSPRNAESLK
ncbi:TetR/AcrR family transcriptional regulator [Nonomuraea glycinis]|uniref:TetR/AcrR family transcriptional regulator n=1 Tax=Nonomuraea glycinis TaxID=2047744 RepID=UPI00166E938C|nr:TetR/AcrR family transcriptional regulator [Nonomuraea glycinis]MCA2179554.1 TetR/AcrR family transcriptional regulator [Nonomuraea glycinis]